MDFDRRTGARLTNYESALQSVEILLFTLFGERVMLREFGAGLLERLGRKLTANRLAAFMLLLAAAIDLWEPRFRVRRVIPGGSVEALRLGHVGLSIEVEFRPRGHLGDTTVEAIRIFGLRFGDTPQVVA